MVFRPEADTTLAHGFSHGAYTQHAKKGRRPTQFLFVKRQERYRRALSESPKLLDGLSMYLRGIFL